MKKILIFGATSAIAIEVARIYVSHKAAFFLVGRSEEKLEAVKLDLLARGASSVEICCADFHDYSSHSGIIDLAFTSLGSIDISLFAHGSLPDQSAAESDVEILRHEFEVNFLTTASFLTILSDQLAIENSSRSSSIVVISSVAGDRGRQSNYVYGSAKGALSVYLQGLRNRLQSSGVHVLTVKPGFVDTPMTSEIKKGPLFVKPEVIARGIVRAEEKKKDVVYLPWFWLGIMTVIKSIPECIFKRLKL